MKKNMKKIVSMLMAVVVLLATQVPTPAYAAAYTPMYDTATKVAGTTRFEGVYNYKFSIVNNKLLATGIYDRTEDPSKHTVQLVVTKPVTANWYVGTDGIGRIETYTNVIKNGPRWELKTTLTGLRNTSIAGNKKISMEIDLSGLADGVYNFQEIITKNGKKEGSFGSYLLLVVHKGTPTLQTTWIYAFLTSWWHDAGFWID